MEYDYIAELRNDLQGARLRLEGDSLHEVLEARKHAAIADAALASAKTDAYGYGDSHYQCVLEDARDANWDYARALDTFWERVTDTIRYEVRE